MGKPGKIPGKNWTENFPAFKGSNSESLIDLCSSAASRMSSQSLQAIWKMVSDMTNTISLPSGKSPFQQRTDPEVKSLLIQSARSHLEEAYFDFIQQTVNSNLREAQRGALPGTEQVYFFYIQNVISCGRFLCSGPFNFCLKRATEKKFWRTPNYRPSFLYGRVCILILPIRTKFKS